MFSVVVGESRPQPRLDMLPSKLVRSGAIWYCSPLPTTTPSVSSLRRVDLLLLRCALSLSLCVPPSTPLCWLVVCRLRSCCSSCLFDIVLVDRSQDGPNFRLYRLLLLCCCCLARGVFCEACPVPSPGTPSSLLPITSTRVYSSSALH